MRECVVGIHGNGVAAEIWQQEEGRAFRLDRRWRPGLVSRWQEGDSLSEAGEQWLCHTLEEARRWAKELCCQSVQGLGGSPLRYSGGRLGLEDRLGQALGAPVQTLSGEQAADLLRRRRGRDGASSAGWAAAASSWCAWRNPAVSRAFPWGRCG